MNQLILLVDDDREMRYAMSETLKRCGYIVETASEGNEAIEKFSSGKFCMVITDIRMTNSSEGIHVLKEIKRQSQDTPVVIITAYGTIDNAVEAMKLGAFDYLIKPFSIEALEEVVKRGIASMPENKNTSAEKKIQHEIVTQDPKMQRLLKIAEGIALSDVTVLIEGESGTGKEMFAKFIHNRSRRISGSFTAINCAAIPDGLLESELFGYEKGSFTGAINKRNGKFIQAHNGTLLLDEISEMSLPLQAKLLRVLQERQVDTIGGREPVDINIRVIATTNKSLKKEVEEGRFREDLYYRLNVFPVTLPPLRDRSGDIPYLAEFFLTKHRNIGVKGNRLSLLKVSGDAMSILQKHEWRGNIRELENTMERAILLTDGDTIMPEHIMIDGKTEEKEKESVISAGLSVHAMERSLIMKTLEDVKGNRTMAAKLLGIGVRTLRNKLKEYREEGVI
ncbi:MAG: sigma-54-dependent Fis family transcriptional regulator [Nitrospirae bacterium]|nr:sigma-54-dependent Fis family transcriptional regulator [Nitrospirota bacterium]